MTGAGGAKSRFAITLVSGIGLLLGGCSASLSGGAGPTVGWEYRVYVANESSDLVSRVVFDGVRGARVEREIPVGIMPADTDGPHGVLISPDGEFLYVTIAHGTPDGWLWKFRTGPDSVVASATLGRFPATMAATPDGQLLVIANFNLHGDPVASDLSVVYSPDLTELTRIETCVTPHGGRMNASGMLHYSACVGSDQVVETSLASYSVSARFSVQPGREGSIPLNDDGTSVASGGIGAGCSPTWVTPGVGAGADRYVYVTCSAARQVLELDVTDWSVVRRFGTGGGPYNMAITPDGRRLVVTLRGDQAVMIFDLGSGEELATLQTSRPFTHGVAISPDGRYAFVTNEAAGSVRGTLDVFDLARLELVATVGLQHQPGGIGFWRADPIGEGPRVGGEN